MAVFRSSDNSALKIDLPKVANVVDNNNVGIEVDGAGDVGREDVREVDTSIVERLVESVADGARDTATNTGRVKSIDTKVKVGKGGANGCEEIGRRRRGDKEVKGHTLRTGGVLEDGENGSHGAAEVVGIEGHSNVHTGRQGAFFAVAKGRGLTKGREGEGRLTDDVHTNAVGGEHFTTNGAREKDK